MGPFLFSLLSVALVSLISVLGVAVLLFKPLNLKIITPLLVSFAVGSLLGDSFIHLLPESFENIPNTVTVSLLVILGFMLFFSLEKILNWHHCHDPDCSGHHPPIVALNLTGDAIHNYIDGLLIAASFFVNTNLGLATTLAVALHEIPQEIGDMGILIHQGLSVPRALKFNLLSALFSFAGVFSIYLIGSQFTTLSDYLIPVTAGGFIYLSASDLVPQLHHSSSKALDSFLQFLFISLGVSLMVFLTFIE